MDLEAQQPKINEEFKKNIECNQYWTCYLVVAIIVIFVIIL